MRWKKKEIGELVTLRQGFAINKKTNHHMSEEPTSLHLLRIGDMKDGNFSICVKDTIPSNFIAKESDIIYTRTGQVGLVFRRQHGVVHNNCFTVTSKDVGALHQQFLYYALQEESFYEEAISRATGAAQPDLPHGAFNSIQIFLPPIDSQIKITETLNAYDDLIENNQKQIKLLEEAAQRLYKEWFVDLRFPGYETTPVVDGVPEGWRREKLSKIADVNKNSLSAVYTVKEINYIDLSSVSCGQILDKTSYSLATAPGRAKRLAVDGDIIWGMVRPNLKSYALVLSPSENDVFSTGFSVLSAKAVPFSFLYCAVTTESFVGYLVNCTNGAAYPAVKPEHFANAQLLISDKMTMKHFNDIVEPMLRRIHCIATANKAAQQARDRLLPKLMSGELEV